MGYGAGGMPGSRYMYAGQNARTADVAKLCEAQAMEERGESSEDIRRATGWFRGMDGKWRFEFSDADMMLHLHGDAQFRQDHPAYARYQELMNQLLTGGLTSEEESELRRLDEIWGRELSRLSDIVNRGSATLDMVLEHPALFEAYPQLREVKIRFDEMPLRENGYYDESRKAIVINNENRNSPAKLMNTLVHEIQHSVQHIEGFEKGSNPEYWETKKAAEEENLRPLQAKKDFLTDELDYLQDQKRKLREEIGWYSRRSAFIEDDIRGVQEGRYSPDGKSRRQRMDAFLAEMQELEDREKPEIRELDAQIHEYENQLRDVEREMEGVRQLGDRSADYLYNITAGEIEARDTAARRSMTDEERRNTRPDIDRDDVVFAEDAAEAFELNEGFEKEFDNWLENNEENDRLKDGGRFLIGTTSSKLHKAGVDNYKFFWGKSKIAKVMKNPEMTDGVIKAAVRMVENPVVVMDSLTVPGSVVMFGDASTANGKPVMVSLLLHPESKTGEVLDYGVITSAYGRRKNNTQNLINRSRIRYIDEDKNRTDAWSKALGLQLPSASTIIGSDNSISDSSENSNTKFGTPVTRFSMADEIEETPDLVALHNVTEEKLRSIMELGGLPMPSIAIVKAADGHAKYGPITFLFDKSTIDPQADRRNRVYGSDAWTPTSVDVNYKVDDDRVYDIEQRMNDLAGRVAGGILRGNAREERAAAWERRINRYLFDTMRIRFPGRDRYALPIFGVSLEGSDKRPHGHAHGLCVRRGVRVAGGPHPGTDRAGPGEVSRPVRTGGRLHPAVGVHQPHRGGSHPRGVRPGHPARKTPEKTLVLKEKPLAIGKKR